MLASTDQAVILDVAENVIVIIKAMNNTNFISERWFMYRFVMLFVSCFRVQHSALLRNGDAFLSGYRIGTPRGGQSQRWTRVRITNCCWAMRTGPTRSSGSGDGTTHAIRKISG
jgi:hypothetical protein